jgi:hypothetical protein
MAQIIELFDRAVGFLNEEQAPVFSSQDAAASHLPPFFIGQIDFAPVGLRTKH